MKPKVLKLRPWPASDEYVCGTWHNYLRENPSGAKRELRLLLELGDALVAKDLAARTMDAAQSAYYAARAVVDSAVGKYVEDRARGRRARRPPRRGKR